MSLSAEQHLTALSAASRDGDVEAVVRIWREMTSEQQEGVVLRLLDMRSYSTEPAAEAEQTASIPIPMPLEPTATTLIPKSVDDLRGLTGAANDDGDDQPSGPIVPQDSSSYRARWIRRWKASVAMSALAVTMLFAVTGDVSSYGPMEWFVAIVATVLGGGLLVGTLVTFVVAAV